ncbi:GNAT family N-acetyltransferase [Saccharopolyspora spinosa]|uniref:Ribosomal protein S18 acetylase RimI-like enzyme n=1 Tax=Saccharopolyspora spinosa TaxID=60894 RepID=A0A2N3Y1Q8_SACSN|nr:GNAT family N-acetyltransferase [Saccharopolyspora spinosa]PKW16878.1 ribosomal protein S18 acetylase RimI-like enzyme [Saccharopolyspora spinosa]
MAQPTDAAEVRPVTVRDPEVIALIEALDSDLAESEYTENESFGYSTHELKSGSVHLVGASVGDRLVGIGGIELQDGGFAELKRFYVAPGLRGHGLADAILDALERHARDHGAVVLRLETGDRQKAAISFYRRRGFQVVPRFGPYVDSEASVCMQRDLLSQRGTLTTDTAERNSNLPLP